MAPTSDPVVEAVYSSQINEHNVVTKVSEVNTSNDCSTFNATHVINLQSSHESTTATTLSSIVVQSGRTKLVLAFLNDGRQINIKV